MIKLPIVSICTALAFSRAVLAACLFAMVMIGISQFSACGSVVEQLRCEYLKDPLGIDTSQPRLSWVLEANQRSARDQRQSAYQILVASSRQKLKAGDGDLWDSGKVGSEQSVQVRYAGRPLGSQ